jgi:hypothetical protein
MLQMFCEWIIVFFPTIQASATEKAVNIVRIGNGWSKKEACESK